MEMHLHRIEWQIPRGEYIPGWTSNKISLLGFASGWSIVCVWSSELPNFIEIRRATFAGHFVINVNLILFRNGTPVHKIKSAQFMDSGCGFIQIKLDDARLRSSRAATEAPFTLKGLIDTSPIKEFVDRSAKLNHPYLLTALKCAVEFSNDFEKLLDPQTACVPADVTVKCGNASFPAHKIVLSARSPVFAAMFANPMSEGRDNEVVITDLDVSVLRDMLKYMYSCKYTPKTVSSACDLMMAADKYQVPSIVTACRIYLQQNVSDENVLLLLDLGDAIAERLKSTAMAYLEKCPEFSVIQNSEAWKSLQAKKPALAIEILSTVMKSKEEKLMWYRAFQR